MPSQAIILAIDDDLNILETIQDVLSMDPYTIYTASRGLQGLALYEQYQPDLVLSDIMLPDILGLDICRQIKQKNPQQLFIFMSGLEDETDQVVGLELGADDYIIKPFTVKAFRARIRALLRRREHQPHLLELSTSCDTLCLGELRINATTYKVSLADQELSLTHMEFELLNWLATHSGQLFTRQQLLSQLWQDELDVNDRAVDALIRRLRDKLGDSVIEPRFIETIRGMGYRFKAL